MTKVLSAAEVAAFLAENPDFFSENEDLLTSLKLPDSRKGTVSLVEKQMDVLRQQQRKSRQQLQSFVDAAEQNKDIFDKSIEASGADSVEVRTDLPAFAADLMTGCAGFREHRRAEFDIASDRHVFLPAVCDHRDEFFRLVRQAARQRSDSLFELIVRRRQKFRLNLRMFKKSCRSSPGFSEFDQQCGSRRVRRQRFGNATLL